MNRSFSITRTAKVVSWLFENNKRQLGVLAGVMLGVMGFETVVNMLGDYYQFAYHHVVIQAGNMALTMIFLLLLLSPAFIHRGGTGVLGGISALRRGAVPAGFRAAPRTRRMGGIVSDL